MYNKGNIIIQVQENVYWASKGVINAFHSIKSIFKTLYCNSQISIIYCWSVGDKHLKSIYANILWLRKSDIFYSLKILVSLYTFLHYHPCTFHVVCNANPSRHSIFCCLLKLEVIEGKYLVNECTLHTNAFIIIKILSKKWRKQKH